MDLYLRSAGAGSPARWRGAPWLALPCDAKFRRDLDDAPSEQERRQLLVLDHVLHPDVLAADGPAEDGVEDLGDVFARLRGFGTRGDARHSGKAHAFAAAAAEGVPCCLWGALTSNSILPSLVQKYVRSLLLQTSVTSACIPQDQWETR